MIVDERALVAAVRELAAENPDFVYEAPGDGECKYVHREDDGNLVGGCIVGQAALKVGVPVEKLLEFDELENPGVLGAFEEFQLNPDTMEWLDAVQREQDCSSPWAVAVEHADAQGGEPDGV